MTENRFSLLLLEPYEIYFEDFYADLYCKDISENIIIGKLKICSKSIVFEPKEVHYPLYKFNYKEITSINGLTNNPKVFKVETKTYVEMLEGNVIAPYKFKNMQTETFTFNLKYVTTDDCLPKMQQLKRASTLPIHEQNSMIAIIAYSWHNRISFDPLWFESIYEKVIIEKSVNTIQPLVTNPGRLLLTNHLLYYQPFNNIQKKPVLKINLSNISQLMKRRFMLKQIGLEIVYNTEESQKVLYVAFMTPEDRDEFYNAIIQQPNFNCDDINSDSILIKWQHGDVSNYEYLLYLNSLADRSFNDLTQYPVFPWIIKDYTSESIDLSNPNVYRDLQKPVGALNIQRLMALKERCTEMDEPKYLFGSMYSAPGLVIFYLARKFPELQLCLQNGKFDHPDRIFNSVADTFKNCMTNMSDFKELIPEFYDVAKSDFLINKKKINFGQRYDNSVVNDVQLPPWASSSADFVKILNEALESDIVSANLHHWIDLIFGYKQRGEEALKANNLFYHLCYEGSVNLNNVSDLAARHALEVQILEFGQIPKQLFTTPHPQKLIHPSMTKNVVKTFNMKLLHTFDSFKDKILNVYCCDDLLIACCADGSLKCYKSFKQIRNVQLCDFPISSCVTFPGISEIICSSWNNTIITYCLDYGKVIGDFEAHDDSITCLKDIHMSGEHLIISGSTDCYAKIWKWIGDKKRMKLIECLAVDDKITCLDVISEKNNLNIILGCKNGDIIQWKFNLEDADKREVKRFNQIDEECLQLKFHKNGLSLAACFDSKVIIFDCFTTMPLFTFTKHTPLTCLEWYSEYILIGDSNGILYVLDVKNGYVSHELKSHDSINCILSLQNNCIAIAGVEKRSMCIKIWKSTE